MARDGTSLSYLYQREIQPVEPVSLERSDFEEQQEDEEEDGILEYDSQVMMMTFHLWNERLIFTLNYFKMILKLILLEINDHELSIINNNSC